MILGLTASTIEVLIEYAGVALFQIGADEARVGSVRADFDARDDALDPAPALRAVEEFLETALLALRRRGLEARLRRGFEPLDMTTQSRRRRDAEDVIEAV